MKKILTLLAVVTLTACQSPTTVYDGAYAGPRRVNPADYAPTPYTPNDGTQYGGYDTIQVAPGIYVMGFLGNAATPRQVAKDSALYRAAEVTVNSGYRFFRIDWSSQDTDYLNGRTYLPSGNWTERPFYVYRIVCTNVFLPDSIDASRLITSLGTAYAAR
jgi:hypothetical protein